MGGDDAARAAYPRSKQTEVRGVTGIEVDGRPLPPGYAHVRAWFSEDREGRPAPPWDVWVIVGCRGVPDDAPLRTWLEGLPEREALVSLTLRRADAPLVSCRVCIRGQAPPDGKGTLTFAAGVAGDTRDETARALGLQP